MRDDVAPEPARPGGLLANRATAFAIARFVVGFAFLAAPWPGLDAAFVGAVGAVATAVADPLTASSNVTFVLRPARAVEEQPAWRGVISVRQDLPDGPVSHAGAIDLRRAGYLQLATFASLALAWPPKSRRRALLAGAVAFGIVAATVAVPIFAFLSTLGVASLPGVDALVSLAARALVAAPGMAYAVPGLAWLAARSLGRRSALRPT